eukprot:6176159-Pleurochrysis_carterae.AAC.1
MPLALSLDPKVEEAREIQLAPGVTAVVDKLLLPELSDALCREGVVMLWPTKVRRRGMCLWPKLARCSMPRSFRPIVVRIELDRRLHSRSHDEWLSATSKKIAIGSPNSY